MVEPDRERPGRIDELVTASELKTADDYFHAA